MQNNNHWISKKKILGRIAQLSTPTWMFSDIPTYLVSVLCQNHRP